MWNRQEVKAKGKEAFKRNYWNTVLAAFIYTLLFAASSGTSVTHKEDISASLNEALQDNPNIFPILIIIISTLTLTIIIATLIRLFLINPIEVGCGRYFMVNIDENAQIAELGHPFKNNYMSVVVGLLVRDLLIGLGFALLIIPGCILLYSYRMVPYILAEEPDIKAIDALKKSRAMMKGNKWDAFVYDLSFILWYILVLFTLGLAGVFYVNPYKLSSDAALYKAIKG